MTGIPGNIVFDEEERLKNDCVLVAGGGPVGLVLATVLASYGISSVIFERNETTTRYEY